MKPSHRRHDIPERTWELLEPHLPGREGAWGGIAKDNRLFIDAVFWMLRTGAPWRDLPPDLGDWKNVQRRFCRWRDKGMGEALLETLIDEPDYEWLMIDALESIEPPHPFSIHQPAFTPQEHPDPQISKTWARMGEIANPDLQGRLIRGLTPSIPSGPTELSQATGLQATDLKRPVKPGGQFSTACGP